MAPFSILDGVLFLDGVPQHYSWGKYGPLSLCAKGCDVVDNSRRYAELWFGSHARGVSTVNKGQGHMPPLSFMVKLLSIDLPLSLQVHPQKDLAVLLHARDPSLYPDEEEKNEIAIAVTPLVAVLGFRSGDNLSDDPLIIYLLSKLTNEERTTFRNALHSDSLKGCVEVLLALPEDQVRLITTHILSFQTLPFLTSDRSLWSRLEWFTYLAGHFGTHDRGLLIFLLLELHRCAPGEALSVEAGTLHAYLYGDVVEVLSSSDNVIRCGFTEKYVDISSFLQAVHCSPKTQSGCGSPQLVEKGNEAFFAYPQAPSLPFVTYGVRAACLKEPLHLTYQDYSPSHPECLLVCTEGSITLVQGKDSLTVSTGHGALSLDGQICIAPSGGQCVVAHARQ
jgi:mannose-6-phosphate isomerase class I